MRAPFVLVLLAALLIAACSAAPNDQAEAPIVATSPTTIGEVEAPPTDEPNSADPTTAPPIADADAQNEAEPDPTPSPNAVPAYPDVVVSTVAGGQIDFGSLEGQDIVLWFWAPW